MAIPESEARSCLTILVAIMKADGRVDPAEKKSLAAALGAFELGETPIDRLLESDVDLDAALASITSAEGRAQAYRSAYFMAHADGHCGEAEARLLTRVEAALRPSAEERARVSQVFGQAPEGRGRGRAASLLAAVTGLFEKKRR